MAESRIYREQEARLKEQLADLRVQLVAGNDFEKGIRQHRLHIIERILCLQCPRCQQAFVDFTGVCALECSRCKCSFCAFCLADCGDDEHAHVLACCFNIAPGRDHFMPISVFNQVQKERRQRLLGAYFRERVADEREWHAVRAVIELYLADLNMALP